MAQRSHVPKFGNWDGDNVPYTAYFENARKGKSLINPNDPEQNPEAFNIGGVPRGGHAVQASTPPKYVNHRNIYDQQKSASHKTMASDQSSSDKSRSDNSVSSVLQPNHQCNKSRRNKYTGDSHNNYNADDLSFRSVSVPKFGQWDEKDPRSGEGFTVIFNKVKEEKQIAASKFPPVPLKVIDNSQKKEATKKFCCLF